MGAKKRARVRSFDQKYRDDPRMIAEYLNAALATGKAALFIKAIGSVMRARGMGEFSSIGVSREGLYRSFAGNMSPRFKTVLDVLLVLDIEMIAKRRTSGQ